MGITINNDRPAGAAGAGLDLATLRHELGDDRLQFMTPNWSQFTQSMINVSVTVRYWRATQRLTLEDMGLERSSPEFQKMAENHLKLGHQQLIPAELAKKIHSIEVKARQNCERYGIKSPWGGYLILKEKYPTWREVMERLQRDFYAARDEVCDTRDEWVDEILKQFEHMEIQAEATRNGVLPELAMSAVDLAAIERKLQKVRASIPTADVIRSKFLLDWVPSVVERPELLADGVDVAALERRRDQVQRELDETREILKRNQAALHRNAEWEQQQQDLRHRALMLQAEREIAVDAQRAKNGVLLQEFQDLAGDVAAKCRELIARVAHGILKSKAEKGRIFPQQLEALRGLVEDLRSFNVMQDPEIDQIAARVREVCGEIGRGGSDKAEVTRALDDLYAYARISLRLMDREDRLEGKDDRLIPNPAATSFQERMERFNEARERLVAPREGTVLRRQGRRGL